MPADPAVCDLALFVIRRSGMCPSLPWSQLTLPCLSPHSLLNPAIFSTLLQIQDVSVRMVELMYSVLWPHSMLNPAAVLFSTLLQIQDVSVRVVELMDHVLSMYDRAIGQYTAGQCLGGQQRQRASPGCCPASDSSGAC